MNGPHVEMDPEAVLVLKRREWPACRSGDAANRSVVVAHHRRRAGHHLVRPVHRQGLGPATSERDPRGPSLPDLHHTIWT